MLARLRSCTPDTIGAFATSLFVDETSPLRCPLLNDAAEEVLPPELRGYLREWRTQAHAMSDPIAAVLYLLQRCAEVRFGRTRGADVRAGDDDGVALSLDDVKLGMKDPHRRAALRTKSAAAV